MNTDQNYSARYYSKDQDIRFRMTTPEEERELFDKAKAGDEVAREFLIRNHLLFAAMKAQEMVNGALPKDEVISAANFAVMKAYEGFKPEFGYRFTTYLRPFIKGEISALWKSHFLGTVADPSIGGKGGRSPGTGEDISRNWQSGDSWTLASGVDEDHRVTVAHQEQGMDVPEHLGEKEDLSNFRAGAMKKAYEILEPREYALLVELYDHDKSFADLSRERGVSRQAIQSTHARILSKLRRALKKEGVTTSL